MATASNAPKHIKERILVIKLSALGDFIQALGPMAAIRNHHKDAHITLFTTKPFESFAKDCGYFDEIVIDKRPKLLNLKGLNELQKFFNNGNFTRIYDLQNNDRTGMYFRLLKKKNRAEWVGIAKGASHRNTDPSRTAGHAFDGHAQTLALAGITNIEIDKLEWMKTDISQFDLKPPYVLIVSGSAPSHPYKRWPADSYGALCNILSEQGYQPVLLGTQDEADTTAQISKSCPNALDLTAQTNLKQIATLAQNAAGAIGNDTGPMHIIAATGCPSLTLFSAHSNPQRHAPKGETTKVLNENEIKDLKVDAVKTAFFELLQTKA